ncbi:aldehyde oxidase GLOX-like [Pyrus x bretschneideri]|uniref:aldehyde oxidase GLOX-like n=1 Tax=Pyrus x bretschneideri TaxID=225117 RepID=UPI00202F349F|nr:aldehyde oxidase GLOX-like [Pyrus x bretschneideri]
MASVFKNLSFSSSIIPCFVPIFFSCFFVVSHSEYLSLTTSLPSSTTKISNVSDGGEWVLLHKSIGVSAMHMQLLKNDKVIIFDWTDMGPSNLSLPDGSACRHYLFHNRTINDCTAHSLIYDLATDTFRPLFVASDTWCSSGALDANGTLVQTGGYGDNGIRRIRTFSPCDDDSCKWAELPTNLSDRRWYASNQILPDGRVIVVGGRKAFTYEFYPKKNDELNDELFHFRFLAETNDQGEENNLYPFLHLLPDGNLFIFANNRSILFDHSNNRIVKELPGMPVAVKRNYPSTGSSVLLPLKMNGVLSGSGLPEVEILICGGALPGAFNLSKNKIHVGASNSCGRIKLSDPHPKWVMEEMPMPRVMSDMLLLPTGDVIIINGASNGTAGWDAAENPVFNPVLYRTYESDPERRFLVLNPSSIPRMYHSAAILVPDGKILVGGSNPHNEYNFRRAFPTDLSLQAFHPPYLGPLFAPLRPSILSVETRDDTVSYGQEFSVTFVLSVYRADPRISVALVTPSFTTHSFAMNQRMVVLDVALLEPLSTTAYKITAYGPPKNTVAPPGYYLLFLVHAGTPSHGVWVRVQ